MAETKLGKVGLTPKGEWSSSASYEQLDLVSYDGGSWVAKKANTNVTPRANDCWMQVAEKGDKGADGSGSVETARSIDPRNYVGTLDFSAVASCPWGRGNILGFIPADHIVFEETIDGGVTWTVKIMTDDEKIAIFNPQNTAYIILPRINSKVSALCGLRVTITVDNFNVPDGTTDADRISQWVTNNYVTYERYGFFRWMYIRSIGSIDLSSEFAYSTDPTTWIVAGFSQTLAGSPGNNFVKQTVFDRIGGHGGKHIDRIRFTFFSNKSAEGSSSTLRIINLAGASSIIYESSIPAVKYGDLFTYDSHQNAAFPANLSCDGARIYSEKPFRFIESITFSEAAALERTAEPDGTPYNFREVYLKITYVASGTAVEQKTVALRGECNGNAICHTYIQRNVNQNYGTAHFYNHCGRWFSERYASSSDSFAYEATRNGGSSWIFGGNSAVSKNPSITRLYSYMSDIVADTTIAIWAVDA